MRLYLTTSFAIIFAFGTFTGAITRQAIELSECVNNAYKVNTVLLSMTPAELSEVPVS